MKITAELSLYPLREDYIPVILGFIDALREQGDLRIVTNAMSTQICGESEHVFAAVAAVFAASTRQFGKQVLVAKFIPWELELSP